MAAQGPTKEEVEAWFKEKVMQHKTFNLSIAEAIFVQSTETIIFWKPSKPCHVSIHW